MAVGYSGIDRVDGGAVVGQLGNGGVGVLRRNVRRISRSACCFCGFQANADGRFEAIWRYVAWVVRFGADQGGSISSVASSSAFGARSSAVGAFGDWICVDFEDLLAGCLVRFKANHCCSYIEINE